jgi:hypothetical protein
VLGRPVPTLDLVGGERRAGAPGTPFRHADPGGSQRGNGRIGD